jgi:S-phase kinase-associated protein 1
MNTHSTTMKVLLSLAALIFCASAMDDAPERGQAMERLASATSKQDDEKTMPSPASDEESLGGLDEPLVEHTGDFSLQAEDETEFPISRKAAMLSTLVQAAVEGDKTAKVIDCTKVEAETLELVVEYLKAVEGMKIDEIQKPIRSVNMEQIVSKEQFDFISKWDETKATDNKAAVLTRDGKRIIFQIILAANYMDIKPLLYLGCAKIATIIKGKSPEEIKKILGDDDAAQDVHNTVRESGMNSRRRVAELLGLDCLNF